MVGTVGSTGQWTMEGGPLLLLFLFTFDFIVFLPRQLAQFDPHIFFH